MKKAFTIFALFSLLFALSSFPARAQTCPSGGVWTGACCDYKDSTHLIPDPDPEGQCNSEHCQKEKFDPNPGGLNYGGGCKYCNPNVCKHGSACEDICNWNCCAGAPPPPDDEGDCHIDDKNLIACCPVTKGAPPSLLEKIVGLIEGAFSELIPIKLRVTDFRVSEKFEEATDYYYGSVSSSFEEGVFFKLAPPNLLQEYFPNEGDKIETRDKNAKWTVGTTITSGERGDEDALNDGWTKNVEPYRMAVNNLRDFLVGIPKTENGTYSQKGSETKLASLPPESTGAILGMTEAELCNPPVVEADTKKTCTPSDIKGKGLTPEDTLNLITGGFKLFPKIVDLDFLGNNTTGILTDPDGAAAEDPNYGPGFLEIFKLPDEEYEPRNAKGSAELQAVVSILGIDFPISFGRQELELSYEGTDSHERENSVWPKLSPPGAYTPPTGREPEPYEPPSEPVDYELTPEEIQQARELGLDPELVARASSISAWAARRGWSIDRGILIALTSGESANCTNCGRSDAETAYRSRGWPEQITTLKKALEHWEEYDIRAANSRAAYYVNASYTAALGSSAGALGCSQFLIGTAWPHRHKVSDPSFDLWDKTTAMQAMAAELHRLGWRENASIATKIGVLLGWNRHYSWVSSIIRTARYILAYLDAAGI